ncbi:MAG: hypothetical protein JWM51_283 [Microbacteriaceae bacterium]|jgi:glycopeptide antibiotics resistance protein|nr:hypothetical protein [Microbacteriaceae bacterium]
MTQRDPTLTGTSDGALAQRPEPDHTRARLVLWLLGAYILIVGLVTLSPSPIDGGLESSIDKVLAVLHRHGVPEWFGYNALESTANIAMFVPLAFLVSLLMPFRLWWLAFIIGPALSVAIELTQHSLLSARFATFADVVANSTGAVIGTLLAQGLRTVIRTRDERIVTLALWEERARRAGEIS